MLNCPVTLVKAARAETQTHTERGGGSSDNH